MLSQSQAIMVLHTVGHIPRAAVLLWFLSFAFKARQARRPSKYLSIFCFLLLISFYLALRMQIHTWIGLPNSQVTRYFVWVFKVAIFVWAPAILLDLASVGKPLRWIILSNAVCSPIAFAVSLFAGNDFLSVALPIAGFCFGATALVLGVWKIDAPNLRRRGLLLFGIVSSSGLLLFALSFTIRSILGWPLLTSVGAGVTNQTAEALILTGAICAYLHIRSADVMLFPLLRLYLWVGMAFIVWLCLQSISLYSPAVLLQKHEELRAVLSIGTIGLFLIGATFINIALPYFIERTVFGKQDWPANQRSLAKLLASSETDEEAKSATVEALRRTLGTSVAYVKPLHAYSCTLNGTFQSDGALPHSKWSVESGMCREEQNETIVPISQSGRESLLLRVCTGVDRPGLLKTEQQFVAVAGRLLEARLEAIRGERERINRRTRESLLRASLVESELRALRAQVDPHFLFNVLNSIAELTVNDPQGAESMILRLAETFRYVLTHADKAVVTLREELRFAEAYIAIQKERFGGRLLYSTHLPQTLLDCAVPTLLLQPLLENAMKYGIAQSLAGGSIQLSGERTSQGIELRLKNVSFGELIPSSESEVSTGIGLNNVRQRLRLVFGPSASLTFKQADSDQAEVVVFIPSREDLECVPS